MQLLDAIDWRCDGLTASHRAQRDIRSLLQTNSLAYLAKELRQRSHVIFDLLAQKPIGCKFDKQVQALVQFCLGNHEFDLLRDIVTFAPDKTQFRRIIMVYCLEHMDDKALIDFALKSPLSSGAYALQFAELCYFQDPMNLERANCYTRHLFKKRVSALSAEQTKILHDVAIMHQASDDQIKYRYAYCLMHGIGTAINRNSALALYESIARSTNLKALKRQCFEQILSVKKVMLTSSSYFETLARLYRDGIGCAKNEAMATAYEHIAARLGSEDALNRLQLSEQGIEDLLCLAKKGYAAAYKKIQQQVGHESDEI